MSRRRRAPSRGLFRLCLTAALLASAPSALAEPSRPRPILEVDADAARFVDARLAERFVALETADIDVPALAGEAVRPPLYFRVVPLTAASLRVELWELGKPEGARSVSASGTASLEARRIALAAAELARRFRERRVAELAALRREAAHDDGSAEGKDGVPLRARLAWSAGARGASTASTWLVGPHMDVALRFRSGPRIQLGSAWLVGEGKLASARRPARVLEVAVSASEALALSRAATLDVGLAAAAGSVRVSGQGGDGGVDTWSARGGMFLRLEVPLGRSVSLAAGPDVAAVLHRVDGTLSGLWLGGALSLTATP